MKSPQPLITDVEELRRRAREHIRSGAVTHNFPGDRQTIIQLLNTALATELVCVLRYRNHYYMATGIHSAGVRDEFLEHANEEQEHANQLAERIQQLGGNPEMDPSGLVTRSHSEYRECGSLVEMIQENLVAERIAIESYREMIRYLADRDPTSRRLLEGILTREEEHAQDLSELLSQFDEPVESAA